MDSFEDIKQYLPKYLSDDSTSFLIKELAQLPKNIDKRLYTSALKDYDVIFQGDGIRDLLVINLPDTTVHKMPVMVLSNSCDIAPDNKRYLKPNLIYAPIIKLTKYENLLKEKGVAPEILKQHLSSIRNQYVTQMFYLPQGSILEEEAIVLLDKINNCDSSIIERERLKDMRLFSLSDYGFYLFLFKLSVHFTRVREKIDRREGTVL
jgi:hypothetical protein